jgi:hypothetical protein
VLVTFAHILDQRAYVRIVFFAMAPCQMCTEVRLRQANCSAVEIVVSSGQRNGTIAAAVRICSSRAASSSGPAYLTLSGTRKATCLRYLHAPVPLRGCKTHTANCVADSRT